MSSLERLPADQRAVLALVLQRGRSYDEIANLLAIDRAAVRDRALAALDALGPSDSGVSPERRALITDYLLGQLPARVRDDTRERLATARGEREWAQALASELAPMSTKPLPEIPSAAAAAPAAEAPALGAEPEATPEPESTAQPAPAPEPTPAAEPAGAPRREPTRGGTPPYSGRGVPQPVAGQRSSSRLGGTALLGIALVIAIVVVIVILANNGSSPKRSATTPGTTPTTTSTGTTTGTSTTPHVIATIVMRPPSGSAKARGVAEVVTEGKVTGVIVAADHLTPNTTHNAYAVWLATPGGASHLLGYVSPGVGKTGALKTSGPLPSNVATYKRILITLETTTNTKTPGLTVLQGTL
ncbi:MAG: hypothetical protein M3065_05155 [Actinomycetota bacterium]|nr:hypothetical protein [Actinomycetota bacterium]